MTITFATGSRVAGSVALSIGAEGGTITFTPTLSFTPSLVKLSVRKPAGGLGIGANVSSTPTSTSFDYELMNGQPDATGYYLDWEAVE